MKVAEIKSKEDAIAYLKEIDAKPTEIGMTTKVDDEGNTYNTPRRISKLVNLLATRNLHLDEIELAQGLLEQKVDVTKFGALVPNDYTAPLTLAQKEYIRDNLAHLPPQEIAMFVRTNHQNVRMAQRGQFTNYRSTATSRWTAEMPNTSPPPATVTQNLDRPYGPLTIKEKMEIYDNYQAIKVSDLAKVFNTSTTNIINAKAGRFTRPKAEPAYKDIVTRLYALADTDWKLVNSTGISYDINTLIGMLIKGYPL